MYDITKRHPVCECVADLGRLCASGAKVTSFSSQISSSSEPASSNCWIFSLQRASNKAIFAWGKHTGAIYLETICHIKSSQTRAGRRRTEVTQPRSIYVENLWK